MSFQTLTSSTISIPSTGLSPSPSFSASTTSTLANSVALAPPAVSSESWEKEHYLSLTLWDIDREFQKSNQAYEQWLSKNTRKRSMWARFRFRSARSDDDVGKSLNLGRQVHAALDEGIKTFGAKFEQGDSACTTALSAQLLRVQHEIRVPLEDCALARFSITIPRDDLLTAAKGVRRACLQALRDQHARLQSTSMPFLPPPKFSVKFCPFAAQLQTDRKTKFQTAKVRKHDRHDDREICPTCNVHIPVTMHTGLPNYRHLLFQAHLTPATSSPQPQPPNHNPTFACTACYKTFDDAYGFLDHVFQKELGSERSCQRVFSYSQEWHFNRVFVDSDPQLVEKCLRNCLKRELTRAKDIRKSHALGIDTEKYALSRVRSVEIPAVGADFLEWAKQRRRATVTMTFAKLRGID